MNDAEDFSIEAAVKELTEGTDGDGRERDPRDAQRAYVDYREKKGERRKPPGSYVRGSGNNPSDAMEARSNEKVKRAEEKIRQDGFLKELVGYSRGKRFAEEEREIFAWAVQRIKGLEHLVEALERKLRGVGE